MNRRELLQLEVLLKKMRDDHTWDVPKPGRSGADIFRVNIDRTLGAVRQLRRDGTFYRMDSLAVKA